MTRSNPSVRTLLARPALLALLMLCVACTTPPTANTPVADVLKAWGPPTASYVLQPGGQRLEYASGPFGRVTWMVDVDTAGRVTQARQVLNEAEFFKLQSAQALTGGMTRDELLRWIGTPGERRGARGGGETWSWRYATNDCLWFRVSLDAQGVVQSSGFFIDPVCDAPSDARQ